MFNFLTRDAFTCSLHYFALFHKKQRCRLKLDDSVTRKKAGGRRRTEAFTHTHRGFYTEKSLHKGAFYIQKVLHREVFTLRCFCRQTSRELLLTEVFTRRSLYTEGFLHTDAFAHRSFYTEKPLHRGAFTHQSVYTQQAFTHAGAFTQRSLYTE